MIHGIDVSNYQPTQFSLELLDGTPIDFVIIQVTNGIDGVNSKWRDQAAWARQHGLAVGFYHFGKPGDPKGQALRLSSVLGVLEPGETLWYDWESSAGSAPTNTEKDEFIRELKRLRPGRKVGLYCNVDFWKNRDTTDYCGDGLWIASWSNPVKDPTITARWKIHQFSDGGGKLDHNRAAFDSREAMKVWGGKPEDPVLSALESIRHDVNSLARIVTLLAEEQGRQSILAGQRYDAVSEKLGQLRTSVETSVGDVAQAAVDEMARRLEG